MDVPLACHYWHGESPPLMNSEQYLEQLYEEHAQALFAFLLNFTRNPDETRDALQEVFVKLAKDPEHVASATQPRAFLIKLAHNAAVDLVRRRISRERRHEEAGRMVQPFETCRDPDAACFSDRVSEAMSELPPEQRSVVHLRLWEGLEFHEIAEALGISLNTAASRYRYGIDKMRTLLRPLYEEIK